MTQMFRLTKRERIKLLLKTRQDALEETQVGVARGQLASRSLEHGELWREGSYHELELCLDYLRGKNPTVRWHLIHFYAKESTWESGLKPRRGFAELGLTWLERIMGNVFVPQAVSENAGYHASEAKTYAKPLPLG